MTHSDAYRKIFAVLLGFIMILSGIGSGAVESAFAASKKPAKVKISSLKASGLKMTLKWKKAKNAKKYQVYMRAGSQAWKLKKTLKKTVFSMNGAEGTGYSFKVRGVNGKKKGSFSAVKKISIPAKHSEEDPVIDPEPMISIIIEPADVTVKDGEEASFYVEASGEGLSYQWYRNTSGSNVTGKPVEGATGPELKLTASLRDVGSYYYCRISNDSEMLKTRAAKLEVEREDKAYIISQTETVGAFEGEAPLMMVEAIGVGKLTYQWYKNDVYSNEGGELIEDAVNASYQIKRVYKDNDGDYYYCVVTDTVKKAGVVINETYAVSEPIRITVSESPAHTKAVMDIRQVIKEHGVLTTNTVVIDDKEYYVLAFEDGKALLLSKGESGYKRYILSGDYTWKYDGPGVRTFLNTTFLNDNVTADVMALPTTYYTPDYEKVFEVLKDKVFILTEADVTGTYSDRLYETEYYQGPRVGDPEVREIDYEKDFSFDRTEAHIGKALPREIADLYVDGQLETWFLRSHYDVDWFNYSDSRHYYIHMSRINTDSGEIGVDMITVPASEPHVYTYARAAFWVEIGTDWKD